MKPTARLILLTLALFALAALWESVAPAVASPVPVVAPAHPAPWFLDDLPEGRKSTIEDTAPSSWRAIRGRVPERGDGGRFRVSAGRLFLIGNTRHAPTLTVSPRVGIAPLMATITLRLAEPMAHDRELELTAWDAADEDMAAPLFRSTRDVVWDTSTEPATAAPQTLRARWELPKGSVLVVGCVFPQARCRGQVVVVS